ALGVGDARLDLDLTATGTGPRAVALSGRADPRPLLPPTAARLLGQPVALAAELALGDNAMLRRFHIESGANRIAFDGALDLNDFSGSGRAELDLPDAAVLAPVLAVPVGGRLALMADLKMDREGQTAKLEATGTDLLFDRFRVQGAQLTGTASRPSRDGAGGVDATLSTQGLVRAGPESGPPLPPDLRIDLAGTISPDFRSLKAGRLAATGAGADLGGPG